MCFLLHVIFLKIKETEGCVCIYYKWALYYLTETWLPSNCICGYNSGKNAEITVYLEDGYDELYIYLIV